MSKDQAKVINDGLIHYEGGLWSDDDLDGEDSWVINFYRLNMQYACKMTTIIKQIPYSKINYRLKAKSKQRT